MILRKLLLAAIAIAAMAAAAAVLVVAAAFALYAYARESLSPAVSSAAVVGAAALLMVIGAGILALRAGLHKREPSLGERAAKFAKDKPLAALAAAAAAGFVAIRNPQVLMGILISLLEPKSGRRS